MATNRAEPFHIPPEMRAIAESSVEQAKQAVAGFISAAQRTVSALEGQAETARQGAKDVQEMLALQAAYIQSQMRVLAEQAKELGQSTGKMATDPLKSKV
jgi:hypothetical protein